ncbi:MAG TPA: GNAT family N-acetyltransferase [Streptosporangiaceae bacterium]
MDVRSLGYRTDLMVRRLEGSQIEDHDDCLVIRSPQNPTYWWGNFLLLQGPPEPDRTSAWLSRFATEFPGARHVAIGIDVTEAALVEPAGLLAAGLREQRAGVLTAARLSEPPRPNTTATYRALAGDDDWQQAAELRAVLSAGEPGGEPLFLAARIAAERALAEAGHGSWFGAFVDGRLVAQLGLITDGGGIARYQNVETHPAQRRQGLAGTLVWQAGQQCLATGATTLVMVADPDDVAIRVYRSVGFTDAETQIGFERPPAAGS